MSSFKLVILVSGSAGFISLLLLLMVPPIFQTDDTPASNLEISCWCPSQFTSSMVAYANNICKENILDNQSHMIYNQYFPDRDSAPKDNFTLPTDNIDNDKYQKRSIAMLIALELLMVAGLYICLSFDYNKFGAKCRTAHIIVHVASILFFLVASVAPFGFMEIKDGRKVSAVRLCDFDVRHTTRVHEYVVQCVITYERSSHDLRPILILNAAICAVTALLTVGSFVHQFKSGSKKCNSDKMIERE